MTQVELFLCQCKCIFASDTKQQYFSSKYKSQTGSTWIAHLSRRKKNDTLTWIISYVSSGRTGPWNCLLQPALSHAQVTALLQVAKPIFCLSRITLAIIFKLLPSCNWQKRQIVLAYKTIFRLIRGERSKLIQSNFCTCPYLYTPRMG